MTANSPDFIKILHEDYERLKAKNPRYSIRAYAKKLNIHSATLSSILRGERKIPTKYASEIIKALNLPTYKRNQFIRSLQKFKVNDATYDTFISDHDVQLDLELHRKMILEWEYCAILSLLEIKGAWTLEKIAERFSLESSRTQEILNGLLKFNFIKKEALTFSLCETVSTKTSEDIPSEVLQQAHENELKLATQKLTQVSTKSRDFSSRTIAIDPKKLPEAKKIIQRFRSEISDFLEDDSKSEVYMISIQLFPLSTIRDDI